MAKFNKKVIFLAKYEVFFKKNAKKYKKVLNFIKKLKKILKTFAKKYLLYYDIPHGKNELI